MMEMHGYICSTPLYEYKGWLFEVPTYAGPWPIRKDGEPFKRAGAKFWQAYSEWHAEPDPEQYRVGGGCQRF